jgi:hypothetical protein
LIVSAASPFPTDPKMKFESFDCMSWPDDGYTTLICSGPVTCGTGGSAELTAGKGAGAVGTGNFSSGVGVGVGAGAAGRRGAQAAPNAVKINAKNKRREFLVVISWGWSSCCEAIAF